MKSVKFIDSSIDRKKAAPWFRTNGINNDSKHCVMTVFFMIWHMKVGPSNVEAKVCWLSVASMVEKKIE